MRGSCGVYALHGLVHASLALAVLDAEACYLHVLPLALDADEVPPEVRAGNAR